MLSRNPARIWVVRDIDCRHHLTNLKSDCIWGKMSRDSTYHRNLKYIMRSMSLT